MQYYHDPIELMVMHIRRLASHKPIEMATLLSLPPEILVQIFKSVKSNDLKSLRSTCKRTERAVTPLFAEHFLTNRRHVLTSQSIEVLEEIVTHPYFGPFVKSVAFNCVRSISTDVPHEEDITDSVPPLQVYLEEGGEESHAKVTRMCNIVRVIHANHGKISLGVFFENFYDEQPCHGLVDGLRYCTIDWSTGHRPSYSMMHLRKTLRALLRTCHVMHCPVERFEVDLGRQSTLCRRLVTYWQPDIAQGTTLYSDIVEALPEQTALDMSLEVKHGGPDSRSRTFTYDHVKKIIKVYCASSDPSNPIWTRIPPMRYLMMCPGINEWLNDSGVEDLDMTCSGSPVYKTFFLGHGYLAPLRLSLKHLKLHRINMVSIGVWNTVVSFVSYFPVLESCKLSDLASVEFSADRSQEAKFLEIVHFEAEGYELKNKLLDLAACLQANELTWRSELDDSPNKWLNDLGAKIDTRILDEAGVAVMAGSYHGIHSQEIFSDPVASEQMPARSSSPDDQRLEQSTTLIISQDVIKVAEPGETARSLLQRSKQIALTTPIDERCQDKRSTELLGFSTKTTHSDNESGEYSGTLRPGIHDTSNGMKELLAHTGDFEIGSTRTENMKNEIAHEGGDISGLSRAMTALTIQAKPYHVSGKNDHDDATHWARDLEYNLDRISLKHSSNESASLKLLEGPVIKANNFETGDWATQVNWRLEKVFQEHHSRT